MQGLRSLISVPAVNDEAGGSVETGYEGKGEN